MLEIVLQSTHEAVIHCAGSSFSIKACASVLFFTSDPPSSDLDQLELPVLCDGLRRYLQDLPQPIILTAIYAQMVQTAKGESRRAWHRFSDHLLTVQLA